MHSRDLPIGIFDSGVGGLTVMAEVMKALPHEQIAYLGDTARLPYGNKGADTVIRFSIENGRYLMDKGIKLLVVACNTSTAFALEALQHLLPIPVVGVIAPGVAHAVTSTKSHHIAVLGTRGTVGSGVYQRAIVSALPGATVHAVACPLFVPIVEEGYLDRQATKMIVKEYLSMLQGSQVDTIILGCTHYPLLRSHIQDELGTHVTIIDSASACAEAVRQTLIRHELLASAQQHSQTPFHRYFVSDNPEGFKRIGRAILDADIDDVTNLS